MIAAIILGLPEPASARDETCRPPARLSSPTAEVPRAPARRLPVTGYTLALSWSPQFCRRQGNRPAHRAQCGGEAGRFGFVVHGLWPESGRSWPQWCRRVPPPPPAVVRQQFCRTPSPWLIGHAWAKHGSCMAGTPAGYFRVGNILANSLSYPDMARLSRQRGLTAGGLRRALAEANPGRPPASFGVQPDRGGWLREVQVCLDRRFRPLPCPSRQAGLSDSTPLRIWRGR